MGVFGPGIGYLAAPAGSHTDDILIHTATAGAGEVAGPLLKAGGRYLLEGAVESTVFKATTNELRSAVSKIGEYANSIIRKGEGATLEGTNVSFRVDGVRGQVDQLFLKNGKRLLDEVKTGLTAVLTKGQKAIENSVKEAVPIGKKSADAGLELGQALGEGVEFSQRNYKIMGPRSF